MIHSFDEIGTCATCGAVPLAERIVHMDGRVLTLFCSRDCLAAGEREQRLERRAARLRYLRRLAIGVVFAGACLTPHQWPPRLRPARVPPAMQSVASAGKAQPALRSGWFGPEWPPTETTVLAALGRDAWVHPLAGPVRRMPRSDARVFGAVRPGKRAWECRNGHCGVDLGGEIWGEQVRAAHDGVVDYVQRGLNPEHGGRFVRIAHHDGTVFTQYFHLAAIPRGLERGVPVKGGQIVGLLGDTGVKESQPHLHFSVSIKLSGDRFEKYMDPEPLIALWPLRVPLDGTEAGLVSIHAPPGLPLGSMPRLSAHARKRAGDKKVVDGNSSPKSDPVESEDTAETAAPEGTTGGEE